MEFLRIALPPFATSLVLSVIMTALTITSFKKLSWVIDPKKMPHPAHIHTEPVPKGGGLPVLIAFLITVFLFVQPDRQLWSVMGAAIITVAIGLVDDIKGVSPYLRLGTNFLAAFLVISAGIGILFISNPFGGIINLSQPWWLADLIALLWIPILMNAINWSSGVDGQISGVVTIAAMVLGGISLAYSADIAQWPVAVLAFSLSGAFAGLTIFHYYPQKIMPGYSATSLAGLLLGVISILATAKMGALMMVLAVPLVDFMYLIVKRIRDGKSPVWGSKDHLHHKLLDLGWGKRRIAFFYWGIATMMGVVSLSMKSALKLQVMVGLVLVTFLFLWKYSGRSSKN